MVFNVNELVRKEKEKGMKTIIFAYDELDGALRFYAKCLEEGIKPIIGQKITLGGRDVVFLCKDSEGYRILCRHSADTEHSFSEEECSHFIFATLKDCCNPEIFAKQIPYIFPQDYFSKENRIRRILDNLPDIPFPAGINSAAEYLTSLVNIGVRYRYEEPSPEVLQRVHQELDTIIANHLEKYFLIIWEMTAMCRKRGILYSCLDDANSSMICYVLRITDVDPLKHNLYFECFLTAWPEINPRINLFVSKDVIQHLRNVYGVDCVAVDMPRAEWGWDISKMPIGRRIMIAKDPICNYIPVYKTQRGLSGWDGEYADVPCFNFIKVDCLEKFASVAYKSIHEIPFNDRKTLSQVKKDRTKIYSKYWFSDNVKKRLSDFSLNSFADLIVVEAILNISTDELAENVLLDIIKRQKKGYSPLFDGSDEILGETYGRILFKEQFIQIAQRIAGWGTEKAILFLRDDACKKADDLQQLMHEFMQSAVDFGLSDDGAMELFTIFNDSVERLVPKAWCLGCAKRIWQDSYLKAHYPHMLISKKII